MPDEQVKAVVQLEAESQGAEGALLRIEALLQKIEGAARRTEVAWKSVIQGFGTDTASIRVAGMDELLKGITGIQQAMAAGIGVSQQYAEGMEGVAQRSKSTAQAQREAAAATRDATAAQQAATQGTSALVPWSPTSLARQQAQMAAYQQQQRMSTQGWRWQQQQQRQLPGRGPTAPMPGTWSILGGPGGPAGGAGGAGGAGTGGAGAGGFLGGLGATFATHLRWMARYIILWKGMQAVQNVVKEWVRVNIELDRSLVLLSTSLGGNITMLREYREAMFAAAAAGRVSPTEMAPAAVMTGRIFDPEESQAVMTRAAELAFISGSKVEDITGTLIVMQRQLGISSEEMASVMDALAGSMRGTHLTYADMLPMLDRAVTYSKRYNMTIEETIGLQAGVATATGATGSQLDTMMRRLQNIYETGTTAWVAIDNLGIATTMMGATGQEVRRPMIAIFADIAKAVEGDQGALEELSKALFRAGSTGRTTFEAMIANQDLVTQGYYNATQAAGEWENTVAKMGETHEASVRNMKGAWEEFLASLGLPDIWSKQLNDMADGTRTMSRGVRRVKEEIDKAEAATNSWFLTWGRLIGLPEIVLKYGAGRGPEGDWLSEDMTGRRGVVGGQVGYPKLPPGGVGGPQLPSALDIRTTTLEVPDGANFDDVVKSYDEIVKRWEGTFTDQSGRNYRITQQQITDAAQLAMIWDETGNEFRLFRAFLPALQEAIQENTAALKSPSLRFTKFDPVRFAGPMQRLVGYYEKVARGLGWNEEPQNQVLWGPDDSILQLSATNIGLQLAMHGLTESVDKNTEALNEGMWNIPEGVTALVPITSLFYQNLNKPGADKWASADIAQIVADLIAQGTTVAGGYYDEAVGTAGGRRTPGFFTGGPTGELTDAGAVFMRAASTMTQAAMMQLQAARAQDPYPVYLPPIRGAQGAVVTQPTLAMIGDRGPEAVVPLNQTPGSSPLGAGQPVQVHMTLMMDQRILAEITREAMAEVF